jgi:selenocysteine lyase/cysteine desulfurase
MMYVKQERIARLWPLTCYVDPHSPNIRKFEALGTRSSPMEQGIGEAITVHCIRVTPHVYTRIADLDNFINAIGEIAAPRKA